MSRHTNIESFHVGQDEEAQKLGQLYLGAVVRGQKVTLCLAIPVHTSPAIDDQTPELKSTLARCLRFRSPNTKLLLPPRVYLQAVRSTQKKVD